jgi:hypothetical protein
MTPAYFRDIPSGGLFSAPYRKGPSYTWIKILPTTFWVIDADLSQTEYDRLMRTPPNAVCPDPYEHDGLVLEHFTPDTLVKAI